MDDSVRRELERFVSQWRVAGPALEDQRMAELSRLTDDQARRMTLDLFALWRQSDRDDFGAELVEQQRVFTMWRERGTRAR